jgi:hypothetical protein
LSPSWKLPAQAEVERAGFFANPQPEPPGRDFRLEKGKFIGIRLSTNSDAFPSSDSQAPALSQDGFNKNFIEVFPCRPHSKPFQDYAYWIERRDYSEKDIGETKPAVFSFQDYSDEPPSNWRSRSHGESSSTGQHLADG